MLYHHSFKREMCLEIAKFNAAPILISDSCKLFTVYFGVESTGIGSESYTIKCTKYCRDDLMLVFEDAQCFNSISEPSSEI